MAPSALSASIRFSHVTGGAAVFVTRNSSQVKEFTMTGEALALKIAGLEAEIKLDTNPLSTTFRDLAEYRRGHGHLRNPRGPALQ